MKITYKHIIAATFASLLSFTANSQTEEVVGNLSGEFSVNSGNLSYTLPLVTPEGIHGLRPSLAVTYSNSSGAGLLGAGFTLSASSSISRCNPNVSVDGFKSGIELNNNARFCIDGQKLIAINGDNGDADTEYRNEQDNHMRYFSRGGSNNTPAYWEMQSPEGFSYKYEQVGSPHTRFSAWLVTERSDFFGNTIHYFYSSDLMPELQQISYSGYSVSFNYESREQPLGQYRDGHYFELSKRLSAVVISRSGTEINRYRFIYETIIPDDGQAPLKPLEKLKRLSQVEKCYGLNGQDGCLKPLTFNYDEQPDPTLGLDHPDDRTIVVPRSHYEPVIPLAEEADGYELYKRPSFSAADMNNDGLSDFCYYQVGSGIMCAISVGDGSYAAPVAWTSDFGYEATEDDFGYYSQLQLSDLNSDTYPDFCLSDSNGVRCGLNNSGNGFSNVAYWVTSLNNESQPTFNIINDDIYPDICGLTNDLSSYQCFAGTGTGFSSNALLTLNDIVDNQVQTRWNEGTCGPSGNEHCSLYPESKKVLSMPTAQWIDIDGDLDNDLCWLSAKQSAFKCVYRSIDPQTKAIQLSSPVVKQTFNYPLMPAAAYSELSYYQHVNTYNDAIDNAIKGSQRFTSSFRVSDVNADLIPDICYPNGQQIFCALNQGDHLSVATLWADLSSLYVGFDEDGDLASLVTMRINDMNLDGLADLCVIKNEHQYCAYNQIGSFGDLSIRQSIIADVDTNVNTKSVYENFVRQIFGWKTRYVIGTSNLAYGNIVNTSDINGDGFPEFCYRSIHGILCTSNDNYDGSARLVGITDSFGQTTTVTYGSLINDGLYEPATTIPSGYYETPYNNMVVDTVTVDTGLVESNWPINTPIRNTQSYKYKGFLRNPVTGVAGFSAITTMQNERNVSTTIHMSVEEHLVGQPLLVEEFIGDVLLKTKTNEFSIVNDGHGRHRMRLDRVEEKQYDLDGTLVSTNTTTSADFDSYGFPQKATTTKVMAEDGESLTTVSETQYLHDESNWLLARPDLQTVTHTYQGNNVTRVVDYTYTNGLMTKEIIQPSSINASTIEYTYDALGNTDTVTTSGNGQQRTVIKSFDSMGRVLSLANELGQSEHFVYHSVCPGALSHTDVAGKVTSTVYDFACRQQSIDAPDDNGTTFTYEWATADDNSLVNQPIDHPFGYRNPIVYKIIETNADGTWSSGWFDSQARAVRSESIGFSSDNFNRAVVGDTVYDRFGRTTAKTLPYYKINGEYISPSWVAFTFDDASRVASEYKVGPDGNPITSYYQYSGNSSTISYSDYSKTTQTGVFGQPVTVDENGLTINYTYDPLGNLLTTDQDGVVSTVSYDDRGFKSQQVDPAMGTWTYQYNAFGELVSQTDAKNQTTSFTYDQLGRVIDRLSPEGQTSWIYNASGNGIGQVHQEQGVDATKQWAYDSLGRAISETLSVDGQVFTTQLVYDAFSRLEKTIHPNGLETHNGFDSTGALNTVSIPANQIRGFDADKLQEEYDAVLLHLLEVGNDIASLQERRNFHLSKSLEYQQQALHYAGLLEEVNEEISLLTSLAEEHEDIAARYQQAADDLRAQANAYRAEFGERAFRYSGIKNGRHQFAATWCSDRHRVTGACKDSHFRQVSVSSDNFNTIDGSQPVNVKFTLPAYCDEHQCYPARAVSEPICISYFTGSYYGDAQTNRRTAQVCSILRPHEIYSKMAGEFDSLKNVAASKAQFYRDQIERESTSQLAPEILVYVPTGNTITQWIPIGIDIVTMIPVSVAETTSVWKRMSLNEAAEHYQEKMEYYTELAIGELDAYNDLSQQLHDLSGSFDNLDSAQYHFAQLLQSAGLLIGDDMGVDGLLADVISRQSQWENNTQPLMVWSATMRAANGLLESELFGNGLYTQRTVSHDTGLITSIKTGAYSAISPLRQIDYTFDQRGMIVAKTDSSNLVNKTDEQYEYDIEGRLRSWSFDQHITDEADLSNRHNQLLRTYEYDDRGNMTYKTGAGAMNYNPANQLTSRDITEDTTVNYQYDANGNMLQGDNRTYNWNSFNKVNSVTNGNYTVNFNYDASDRRVVKKSELETIYYVSSGYEKVIKHGENGSDKVLHRHNVWNGDDVVATFEKHEVADDEFYMGDDIKYYHRDHLGNGELVTGADMQVLAQRYYTPYGELVEDVLQREQNATTSALLTLGIDTDDYMRDLVDSNDVLGTAPHLLSEALAGGDVYSEDYRGFTSHETIKELGLVNMNARLYDPVIGRFISADSMITDISQPLDYNRYAYVRNNPMSYRDPSGHWVQLAALVFFTATQLTDDKGLQVAGTFALFFSMVVHQGGVFHTTKAVALKSPQILVMNAGLAGLTISYLQTGDPKASIKAGAWAAVSAGVAHYVGHYLKIGEFDFSAKDNWVAKSIAHGLTQGVISDLKGDRFAAGFSSGLIGSAAGDFSKDQVFDSRLAVSMVAGYLSAKVVGGDGVRGALTAAAVFLYNHRFGAAAIKKAQDRIRIINKKLAGNVHEKTGIPFNERGYPIFDGVAEEAVEIAVTGNRVKDEALANAKAGLDKTPKGFTWHHVEDAQTMQLVPTAIHNKVAHSGGVAVIKFLNKMGDVLVLIPSMLESIDPSYYAGQAALQSCANGDMSSCGAYNVFNGGESEQFD